MVKGRVDRSSTPPIDTAEAMSEAATKSGWHVDMDMMRDVITFHTLITVVNTTTSLS